MNQKESYRERTENKNDKLKLSLKRFGATALVIGVLAGGITGCKTQAKGESKADFFGKVDPSIESITLEEGARIRSDPYVADKEDPSNSLAQIDRDIVLKAQNQIRVSEDVINGDWYGIPKAEASKLTSDPDIANDKDGVVWVNSQRAHIE